SSRSIAGSLDRGLPGSRSAAERSRSLARQNRQRLLLREAFVRKQHRTQNGRAQIFARDDQFEERASIHRQQSRRLFTSGIRLKNSNLQNTAQAQSEG